MHRMNVRGVRTLIVAVCLAGLAGSGGTGSTAQEGASVRGRVEIGIPVTARRPSAAYATRAVGQSVLAPVSELRHVVVFLKNAPAVATQPTVVEIRQKDENFIPRVVAVPVGSGGAVPERRPDLSQRLLALARQDVQPRTLPARRIEGGARHQARRRESLLRDSLAHDRDHHGVQPSMVHHGRRERPLRAVECAARATGDHGVA